MQDGPWGMLQLRYSTVIDVAEPPLYFYSRLRAICAKQDFKPTIGFHQRQW